MAQYASIIASRAPSIRKVYREIENCSTSLGSMTVACRLAGVTAGFTAATLAIDLRGAQHEKLGNKLFIGAPPAEIRTLVTDTLSKAIAVKAAVKKLNNPQRPSDLLPLEYALSTLNDDLNGWKPYGG